ncbi:MULTISPECIES: c-type cytochrome [Leeuwenhoekiella]|uniref:Quinol:cytochrome c oxidoreductase pentaheme cytochrome subunit n=1 Tax=Leeuwenhoekiella palythoae TaxID=573501 RepID=A0A1M5YR29_9FLAO|nr:MULTISPECIES: c-type cytochrome [Leeuwenhoekiella]MEC7782321.1 c-type cytochrome [Bacteroidota bacterium]MEC8682198.1 c-type cytochrome [Bacteroidota bacterium]MEE3148276.1 c-type cytochrome [Bacteroidota bacterium]MEE3226772.1 c-type cytochrome [Bacteroidota bacterium]RXG29415.1 quinol:cytochrome c oxidoreductase pentaheme cytochrome subunit [Leeuwenhoekiella palythoae]
MKQGNYLNSASRFSIITLALLLSFSSFVFAQDAEPAEGAAQSETTPAVQGGDAAAGKALFNANCAACHKLYSRATGPALYNVTERRDREWLYQWIKNNRALIDSGDPEAIAIYEEYNQTAMNLFPQLSNADIDDILAYTDTPKPEPKAPAAAAGAAGQGGGGVSSTVILAILAVVLVMLVAVLFLVNNTLRKFAVAQGVALPVKEARKPIWKSFVENQFLVLVSVIVLLLGGAYFAYGWMMQVGVDQGYQPIQPIHYSHRIHAGDNQIECKYCHSSARTSKTSGIPSLNVCMNCHKSISEVADETSEFSSVTEDYSKEFYDKEIQKLYKATGWDPATQSYTGETQAVEWVRIHNLPDFAYFNHSQHVSVAGVQCQTCHGPVEEMEIMYQNAPLTMGWCINCHRETNVKMDGNPYYEKIHEELSKKYGVEQLTAAQMGGLECGKCHY